MDENNCRPSVSSAKLEANHRNARRTTGPRTPEGKLQSMAVHDLALAVQGNRIAGVIVDPILERINRHLTLPLSDKLDRLLRYETAVHRQLVYTIARQLGLCYKASGYPPSATKIYFPSSCASPFRSATRRLRPTLAASSTVGPRCEVRFLSQPEHHLEWPCAPGRQRSLPRRSGRLCRRDTAYLADPATQRSICRGAVCPRDFHWCLSATVSGFADSPYHVFSLFSHCYQQLPATAFL